MKIKNYPSGLRLVVNEKHDMDIVSFRVFINAGSQNETEKEYGIAHFLEHMFFKSTPKYSYQQLSTFFDELGTQKNAYTGVYKTCYYFKCLGNVFEKSLEYFAEMFFNTSYDKKEIENEKNVILEEYQMGNDDTEKKCITNAYRALYKGTNLEHDVIGTKKTIKSFTSQDLLNFRNKYYVPENMVISVSGNITIKQVEKLLNKYFSPLFKGEYTGNYELPKCVKVIPQTKFVATQKENEQSTIYILTDLGEKTNRQMYGFDLLFAILGFGMSSKFYNVLRGEKALVYHVEADTSAVGKNNVAEIMFATSNDKVCKALSEVLQILKDCTNGDISNEELEKSKNKYIAGMVYSNETNGGISMRNGADLISDNKIETSKQIVADIRSVTLQEVVNCAKEFYAQQNYVVSSVGKCKLADLKCYKH